MNGDGVKRHSLLTEMTVNEDNDVMAKRSNNENDHDINGNDNDVMTRVKI